jgi:DNA-binding NarL/FixJ family response regulator
VLDDAVGRELDRGGQGARVAGEPLTAREVRVASLAARGSSNKEIAAALFLSPKTVERHLSSVYRKRGFRSRTELAAVIRSGGFSAMTATTGERAATGGHGQPNRRRWMRAFTSS